MTPALIEACTGAATPTLAAVWAAHLTAAMAEFEIDTPRRQAAFLSQVGHESGGLQWMAEIWGPTAAQKRYEPPSSLATRLGNTQPGDGKRFKGRGPLQCTGRFNYRKYGKLLKLDLEAHPELLDDPTNACRVSAAYFKNTGCNELADHDDFIEITHRINGGENGLADRETRWENAKRALHI